MFLKVRIGVYEKYDTSWGRAVPSSGRAGVSKARFVIKNLGHLPSIKKLRSSSLKK